MRYGHKGRAVSTEQHVDWIAHCIDTMRKTSKTTIEATTARPLVLTAQHVGVGRHGELSPRTHRRRCAGAAEAGDGTIRTEKFGTGGGRVHGCAAAGTSGWRSLRAQQAVRRQDAR